MVYVVVPIRCDNDGQRLRKVPTAGCRNDGVTDGRGENAGDTGPIQGLNEVLDVPRVPEDRIWHPGIDKSIFGCFVVGIDLEPAVVGPKPPLV